ncbi:hypothetical protein Tco_0736578, partial [Tanacetum coccineum]
EFDQKETLFQMTWENKFYLKHPTNQALYDALMESLVLDEDDMEKAKTVVPPIRRRDNRMIEIKTL